MDDLHKQTNFPSGISTGGVEGSDPVPQEVRIGVRLSPDRMIRTIRLPANTKVRRAVIMPTGKISAHNTQSPTAGTVNIGTKDSPTRFAASQDLSTDAVSDALDPALLLEGLDVTFEATGLDGDVIVALEVTPLHLAK